VNAPPLALALLLAVDAPSGAAPAATPAKETLSKSARRAAARNARPAPEPPEDPGKLLVEAKCGKCHDASRASTTALSESGWRLHLKRMGKLPGAAITEEQAQQIHTYLRSSTPAAPPAPTSAPGR
jgi:cytochrome c5